MAVVADEPTEVARIVADAAVRARSHGAPDSAPTSAREFYDDFLQRLPGQKKRKRADAGQGTSAGADVDTLG